MSDSEFSDCDSVDSDKELQAAFSKGLLQPGLNVESLAKETFICNEDGLRQALQDLKKELPWVERMDVTMDPAPPAGPMRGQLGDDPDDLSGEEVHNDFKREMKFYRQAQAAVLKGIPKLNNFGVRTRRPEDYFAEMAKSDGHMKKVREKLISKQISMERSEKAKKLRQLRKYGKKVQQEVLQKRQKEKKEMMEAVKKYRKGYSTQLDFLESDSKDKKTDKRKESGRQPQNFQESKKRQKKNEKFGFGGQKKRSKRNTADSSADVGGFKKGKQGGRPVMKGKRANSGLKKRLGKGRRQKMKRK